MNDGCNPYDCPAGQRLERQLEELQRTVAENYEKTNKAISELRTHDAVQDNQYTTILKELNKVVLEVQALKDVPGNNWKDLKKTIFATVASTLIGFILGKFL